MISLNKNDQPKERSFGEVSLELGSLDLKDPNLDLERLQYLWAELDLLAEIEGIKDYSGFPPPTLH